MMLVAVATRWKARSTSVWGSESLSWVYRLRKLAISCSTSRSSTSSMSRSMRSSMNRTTILS